MMETPSSQGVQQPLHPSSSTYTWRGRPPLWGQMKGSRTVQLAPFSGTRRHCGTEESPDTACTGGRLPRPQHRPLPGKARGRRSRFAARVQRPQPLAPGPLQLAGRAPALRTGPAPGHTPTHLGCSASWTGRVAGASEAILGLAGLCGAAERQRRVACRRDRRLLSRDKQCLPSFRAAGEPCLLPAQVRVLGAGLVPSCRASHCPDIQQGSDKRLRPRCVSGFGPWPLPAPGRCLTLM